MKYAFSNIAWTPHASPEIFALLQQHGITGIEIAPTKIWPRWEGATPEGAARYATMLGNEGFAIPALQAVLFERPEAKLFDGAAAEAALIVHLTHVADLAQAFGAPVVVLGAPRQRDRGALTMEQATEHAAGVLRQLAEVFQARGTCLCIEPNPRRYRCNFVVNVDEAAALVRHVAHPGFALHLDSAAMLLESDALADIWNDAGELVRHYHISEPDLGDFLAPQVPHRSNLEFLDRIGYQHWCSVEMRPPQSPLAMSGPWSVVDKPHQ